LVSIGKPQHVSSQDSYQPPKEESKQPSYSSSAQVNVSAKAPTPTKATDICGRCGEGISGERTVAMGKKWHKDHFTCVQCNVTITDTFVPKNDQPMCESCHAKSLVCAKCGNSISGSHIDAKGKLYHLECVGGDSCGKCGKPISDVSIQAADRIWHPECFSCANCQKLLQDTFVRKEQDIWCKDCYNTELVCDKCHQPLPTQYVTTKNKKYHSECFACHSCNNALGTDYYDVDGQFQCDSCYNQNIGSCATCGRGLTGQYVKCLGKMFHEPCFLCFSCKGSLEEEFYNVDGNPHCFNCASK